jgi:hypothetical protein
MVAIIHELTGQIEKIDQKLIRLLEERLRLCSDGRISLEEESELLSFWIEEAADRGLDEGTTERIGKLVTLLCRKTTD